jgi:hypothetical protein
MGLKMVICTNCKKEFKPFFEDNQTQGLHCATDVFERGDKKYLAGNYGSTIADGYLYEVLTNIYPSGIICDPCIEAGLEKYHFKLISTSNYFGIDL